MSQFFLSVGYLDNAVRLLRIVANNPGSSLERIEYIASTDDIAFRGTSRNLIAVALEIGWVVVDNHHKLAMNSALREYYDGSTIGLQRELLWRYIQHKCPAWTKHLHLGVKHSRLRISDSNEKQVFQDLNLFVEQDETDEEIMAWWSRASIFSRSMANQTLLETGNTGELLSLNYERNRTGQGPKHRAYYSHSFGYDIESQISSEDTSPLYIEVKSSTKSWKVAELFLSRPEYETCLKYGPSYTFHLWDLSGKIGKLLIVKGEEILQRAPIDSKGGEWTTMSVRFSEFCWDESFEVQLG